jgi:hypothetical protein
MPAAIGMRQRQQIVEGRVSGESYASISRRLGLGYMTVWKIDQQYRTSGRLEPHYERCRHSQIRKSRAMYERAIQLKSEHPGWGAGLIWVELAESWPEAELPSVRTLQRWFHRGQVARRRAERVAKASIRRGQEVHEVWALDAKEEIRLADGSYVSWLTISDEASGAVLATALFPPQALEHRTTAGGTRGHASHDAGVGQTGARADG